MLHVLTKEHENRSQILIGMINNCPQAIIHAKVHTYKLGR